MDSATPSKRARLGSEHWPIGSRAYMQGCANCTNITDVILAKSSAYRRHDGKIRIRFEDDSFFHADPSQFEEVQEEVHDEVSAIQI